MARIGDWRAYLAAGSEPAALEALRRHTRTSRPLGDSRFLERLEATLGRPLRRGKPGPKPKARRQVMCHRSIGFRLRAINTTASEPSTSHFVIGRSFLPAIPVGEPYMQAGCGNRGHASAQ